MFNRISSTTAICGAVDSSFILLEERLGSRRAKLSCIGCNIKSRKLTLERNIENVWELVSDSQTQTKLPSGRIIYLLSEVMRNRKIWICTPAKRSKWIVPDKSTVSTPKKVFQMITQSVAAPKKDGITAVSRRSNGKRLIEIHRAENADTMEAKKVVPIDPVSVEQLAEERAEGVGDADFSLWEGKHRATLYAMNSFGALTRTRPLKGKRKRYAESKKRRSLSSG